jgi:FKBP-type peptidyl-prolyl cis-trans isomerase
MEKFYFLFLVFVTLGCGTNSGKSDNMTTTTSGLKYIILKKGNGISAKEGQEVLIHEKLSYSNNSLLFSSYNLPHPVKILIGGHQAIEGVDEGLRGMKKGEIRKLIVPPALSKRSGTQTFPHPDSTLIYEIELIEILTNK